MKRQSLHFVTVCLSIYLSIFMTLQPIFAVSPWANRRALGSTEDSASKKQEGNSNVDSDSEPNSDPQELNSGGQEALAKPSAPSSESVKGAFQLQPSDLQETDRVSSRSLSASEAPPLLNTVPEKMSADGRKRTIAVLDVYSSSLSTIELQRISTSLRRELKNTGRYQVYHRSEMKKALHKDLDQEVVAYKKMDEYVNGAQKLYDELKYDSALAVMKEALLNITLFDATPMVCKKISEVYLTQALIFQAKQAEKQSEIAFLNAAALDPERQLDPAQYPPDVVAKFYQAKVEFQKKRGGSLTIKTEPSLAEVWMGGKLYGKTPVVVKDLPLGPQNLALVKEGFDPWEKNIMLTLSDSGKPEQELKVTLDRTGQNVSFDALMGELVNHKDYETQITKLADIGKSLVAEQIFASRIEKAEQGWDFFMTQIDVQTGQELARGYAEIGSNLADADVSIAKMLGEMTQGRPPTKFTNLIAVEGNGNTYLGTYKKKKSKKWPLAIALSLLAAAGGTAAWILTRDRSNTGVHKNDGL